MSEDKFIELVKFIEKEILPKNKEMHVSDILLSGNNYFQVSIYEYLKESKDQDVLEHIEGYLKRVWN